MHNEIMAYIEPIYRFCLKRLSNRTEAEDLAQEILLNVLEGVNKQNIKNLNSYIWRVAHNRYARKIDKLNRESIICYGDILLNTIEDDSFSDDKLILADEYKEIFSALHSLSSMYREALVDFYVHDLSISQIAAKHGVSEETIKWRLHTGKKRIKERLYNMTKTYEKIKMFVMCNGSFDPQKYLSNQIHKAIAVACYNKALSIEEICLATGIPTLYLEEVLDFMISGDAIEKVGNKYQTNFIILHDTDNKKMQKKFEPIVSSIAQTSHNILQALSDDIKMLGFYGSQFYNNKLYYFLIPTLVRGAFNHLEESYPHLAPGSRPLRKDGGNGWFIVTLGIDDLDENYSGYNCYTFYNNGSLKAQMIYYWLGASYECELNRPLSNFDSFLDFIDCKTGEFKADDEEACAQLLKHNLLTKHDNRFYFTSPILTAEHKDMINNLLKPYYSEIGILLKDWLLFLKKEYEAFTPKRLKNQINGNISSYSNNATAYIIKELQKSGIILTPEDSEIFTDNIALFIY